MRLRLPKIKNIRFRITLYFTVLVIIVILAINVFSSMIFKGELVRQSEMVVSRKMHSIISDLHEKLASIRAICIDIQNDKEILDLIYLPNNGVTSSYLSFRENKLSFNLDKYASESDFIRKIVFIDAGNNVIDPNYSTVEFKSALFSSDFLQFTNSSHYEEFSVSTLFPYLTTNKMDRNKHYINYYNKFWDQNYNRLGYLVMCIDASRLFHYTEIYCDEIFDEAIILNSNNHKIYDLGTKFLSQDVIDDQYAYNGFSEIKTISHEKYLLFNKPLSYNTDWYIYGMISYESLISNVKAMQLAIILIGLICILAVILISFFIAKGITNPIYKINATIATLDKGEWPEAIRIRSEDELKHLANGINKMIKNLKDQLTRIIEEEENKKRAEIKALQLQIDLLQSQINPHFIYNTLNTFSYLALKNNDKQLRELIQSFNILLRSSMSTENDFVSIEQEIDLTDKFLMIQKSRYGDIFKIFYCVEDELLACKIPKLILQPIVENALFHGIVPKGTVGTVKVIFTREDNIIRIAIIDDGVGIERTRIPDVLEGKSCNKSKGYNNIGLANINDRLKLYFGKGFGLHISSRLGIGTTIEFCIPIRRIS